MDDLPALKLHNDKVREELLENRYFRIAYQEMLESVHATRFGCVLVLRNGTRYTGHNLSSKSHPALKIHFNSFVVSIHAELAALLKTKKTDNLKNSKLYIVREDRTKDKLIKRAHPCVYCTKLLKQYGVKKIYFSTPTGYEMEIIN